MRAFFSYIKRLPAGGLPVCSVIILVAVLLALLLADGFPVITGLIMGLSVALLLVWPAARRRFVQKNNLFRKSILVIDDDEIILKTVRPILMGGGYSVLTATTGEEGLNILRQQRPDLVLLDVILPKMKGREVCRVIKGDPGTRSIPVIFLTAKDSEDDVEAELKAGAETHLTKPVDPRSLLSTIRKILR
jgi:CheY-like chemotaxis protein